MSSKLLEAMQKSQKESKKIIKKKLNPNSSFALLTDEEIALVFAYRAKSLRMSQGIKQSEFSKSANLSSPSTYSNFEQTGSASLANFIKIMRSFDRLHELEKLLQPSTADIIDAIENKRVRKSSKNAKS